MKIDHVTVDVGLKLSVDEETAWMCLKVVELYINQTGCKVIGEKAADGTESFRFQRKEQETKEKAVLEKHHASKPEHSIACLRCSPTCICVRCANDKDNCCSRDGHAGLKCPTIACPDFEPEEKEG